MAFQQLPEFIDGLSLLGHLENTPFGVILYDQKLQMVYCSKRACEIFECEPHDLILKPIDLFRFVPDEDAATVAATIAEISSGAVTHNESLNRNLTKSGKLKYCQWYNSALKDEKGNVRNILSLVHDVTLQVESQLANEKKQRQLSLAFNSAIDPMWLIRMDGPNVFVFETINHAFTKVTGWTPDQVEGQPIEKIMPAASHNLVREKYNLAIESGRIIDYVEEALHPSGTKYGEIRVIPIRGESGDPVRILGIANDITEKVYLQKKLDAERELRSRHITSAAIRGQESERAKVGRELHDNVNQVLTTVKLLLELCLDDKIEAATAMPKCVGYLNNTITEIRNLSKQLSAPTLKSLNFKETLSDLVASVRTAAQANVDLEFGTFSFQEMESELHLTLYRVLQEQLTNIMKYANASQVAISLQEDKGWLILTVSDDGAGFDPTRKREGIGITNMQSRVEMLNGQFRIISSPGAGARLEAEIPVRIENQICYPEQDVLNAHTI